MPQQQYERRVVVLARPPGRDVLALQKQTPAIEVIGVSSGYEAAAELLVQPVCGLVIELDCLTERHVGLLRIARAEHVEIFGMGSFPAHLQAQQLSGVRLVSQEDLPELLQNLPALPRPATTQTPRTTDRPGPVKPPRPQGGLYYVPGEEHQPEKHR